MARFKFYRCGTQEDWERYKDRYPGVKRVIPAAVYMNTQGGIFLVTSREWCDWLLDKTESIPDD